MREKPMDIFRSNIVEVKECALGKGLFVKAFFPCGSTVFKLEGEVTEFPTKYTIRIGPSLHIIDASGIFMNHSFAPSTAIVGDEVLALRDLCPGDELTFDYNASEVDMCCPFESDGILVQGKPTVK